MRRIAHLAALGILLLPGVEATSPTRVELAFTSPQSLSFGAESPVEGANATSLRGRLDADHDGNVTQSEVAAYEASFRRAAGQGEAASAPTFVTIDGVGPGPFRLSHIRIFNATGPAASDSPLSVEVVSTGGFDVPLPGRHAVRFFLGDADANRSSRATSSLQVLRVEAVAPFSFELPDESQLKGAMAPGNRTIEVAGAAVQALDGATLFLVGGPTKESPWTSLAHALLAMAALAVLRRGGDGARPPRRP